MREECNYQFLNSICNSGSNTLYKVRNFTFSELTEMVLNSHCADCFIIGDGNNKAQLLNLKGKPDKLLKTALLGTCSSYLLRSQVEMPIHYSNQIHLIQNFNYPYKSKKVRILELELEDEE
ncbi:hypothetical protein IDJ77_11435 [Mucilaginibacter sp. ZT4R22]|uniref:Uncharacterized protein n=1 Tax=Mucilaginibacter pankratovii TaxID=2772110 RepID=A0ABR7WQ22_9SPHI|nr:hypothetical protein [Mucilaginibacter pankratovii]MBD1364421.1 hypothetical protein [Mucilaginibacter pankratovii]